MGSKSQSAVIQVRHFRTAQKFIAALSQRRKAFATLVPRGWIFRGLSDYGHPLIPAALRPAPSAFNEMVHKWPITTVSEQVRAERVLLARFLRLADESGLTIPEDSQALRKLLEPPYEDHRHWPEPLILSVMALAQHHGVPTRLLDWSRSPLKAALFAASAEGATEASDLICVWALNVDALRIMNLSPLPPQPPFRIVTAPAATNSNLHAQEGCFTLASNISEVSLEAARLPFDRLLQNWVEEHQVQFTECWMRCLTLPKTEVPRLQFELALEGITRATLFPDFYGVVKAMKDEIKWFGDEEGLGRLRAKKLVGDFRIEMTASPTAAAPRVAPPVVLSTLDLPNPDSSTYILPEN